MISRIFVAAHIEYIIFIGFKIKEIQFSETALVVSLRRLWIQ